MNHRCGIGLFCALAATAAGAATFYVDGSAAAGGDGSAATPWRTAQDAVAGVRTARKAGAVKAGEPVEVVFRAGEHSVGAGVVLGAADSGTAAAPVTWRGEGQAVLTGGVRVPNALFKKVSDPAVLERLPEEARGKVYVADVSSLVPGTIPELAQGFAGTPTAPLLFMGGKFATLARWPNADWTSFKKSADKRRDAPGAFLYDNPRARRWNFAEGVWLNGYWTHDWDNYSARVARYGEENGTNDVMRLAVKVPYGVGNKNYGGLPVRRFYAFNLLDELDAPGEWWLDRANKRLYVVPPAGVPREEDAVTLAVTSAPLVQAQGVRHLRFENLSFEGGAGSGMSVNGNDVTVEGCRFARLGGAGLSVNGSRNLVRGVEVCETGRSGINVTSGDRRTLTRGDTLVENCHVHDWAHFQRTYAPAIGVQGCGVTLRRNRMHDAPHTAVLYGGNEHLFEYNEVWRVLMETGDAGAYYTGRDWTTQGNVLRYNYTHDLGDGSGDAANTMGFYFDDCDCGDAVYGNVFHNVARGIMVGGGRDHPIYGNVFSKCKIGLSIDCRGMTWKNWNQPGSWHLEGKAQALDYTNGVWAARYPRLARIMQDHPREPLYNPVTSNLFLDCTQKILALDGKAADECLPRMAPITGNVVVNTVGTNGVKTAKIDVRVAAGFRVFDGTPERPFDVGFADAAHGDFTFTRDPWILRQIPSLRPLLDWFPLALSR